MRKLALSGIACIVITLTFNLLVPPSVSRQASKQVVVNESDSSATEYLQGADESGGSSNSEALYAPEAAQEMDKQQEQRDEKEAFAQDLSKDGRAFSVAVRSDGNTPDPLIASGMDLELRTPHPQMPLYLPPGNEIRMTVKLMDWTMARFSGDNQILVSDASLQEVNQLVELARRYDLEFAPTFNRSKALDELRIKAARRSGQMQADLNGTMEVELYDPSQVLEIARAMQSIALVESVDIESLDMPAPPAADIAPTTPDLEFEQDYLGASPGLGANYLKALGADGANVRFSNVEAGCNLNHEDIDVTDMSRAAIHPQVFANNWDEHGTAVFGITNGGNNGYGVTGIAPESDPNYYSSWTTLGFNGSGALSDAVTDSSEGDVILIEIQTNSGFGGSSTAWAPYEYNSTIWNLTKTASDAGIIVVATAGNGNQNLDDPFYASYMNRGDSGAIMVGAGTSNTARNKMSFSNYGSRLDVHYWGQNVMSAGYGSYAQYGGDENQNYTGTFSGTSSAGALAAGAINLLQSYAKNQLGIVLSPTEMRDYLKNNGHPQGTGGNVGPAIAIDLAVDALIADNPDLLMGQDIGDVAATGSNILNANGQYTVEASGADIWGTSDEFRFVYAQLRGNGEIIARVSSLDNTNPWAKAGIMIRESLAADAANVAALVTPSFGGRSQSRATAGITTLGTAGSPSQAPRWLRLVREVGTAFSTYESADGVNWTPLGLTVMSMPTDVYIGLAVTSHNDGVLTTAVFDNVTVIEYPQDSVDQTINPGNAASFLESHPSDPIKIRDVGNGTIGYIQNNTWFAFTDFEFSNTSTPSSLWVDLEISKGNTTNTNIEIRSDSVTGPLLATVPVTSTGGWATFESFTAPLDASLTNSIAQVYFVFTGDPGFLMDVKSVRFRSDELDRIIEAEEFDSESHPSTSNPISVLNIPGGGQKVGYTQNNTWIKFEDVSFGGYTNLSAPGGSGIELTYASNTFGNTIEVRLDSTSGPLLTTYFVSPTGGNNNFVTSSRSFDGGQVITGSRDLYLVFQGSGFIADVDSLVITE